MNIIFKITDFSMRHLKSSDGDILSAMDVSYEFMNQPLTKEDIHHLYLFSKHLEHPVVPSFKSIHNTKTIQAIWYTIYWIFRAQILCNKMNDMLASFTEKNDFYIKPYYSPKNEWQLQAINQSDSIIHVKTINNYYGFPYLNELFMFINEVNNMIRG